MNQTKIYFPLIFISLEDGPWEPIEPNPNASPEDDSDVAEQDLSQSDWTLASTETVTHEYLTQSGKVVRETITTSMDTTTLDFFYDDSGRPFAFNYTPEGSTPIPITIFSIYRVTLSRSLTKAVSCRQSTSTPRGARSSPQRAIWPRSTRSGIVGITTTPKQDSTTCRADTMTRRIIVSLMRIPMPAQTRAMRLPAICLHTAGTILF